MRLIGMYTPRRRSKVADIVAVKGNLLTDIKQVGKVDFIIKEGAVYKKE